MEIERNGRSTLWGKVVSGVPALATPTPSLKAVSLNEVSALLSTKKNDIKLLYKRGTSFNVVLKEVPFKITALKTKQLVASFYTENNQNSSKKLEVLSQFNGVLKRADFHQNLSRFLATK